MIKVLINGITGKMGTEVAKLVKQQSKMQLLGGFDKYTSHNLPYPVFNNVNEIFEIPDVIIDFSVPEATISLLSFAVQKKISMVIATTGFNKQQKEQIMEASTNIAIFQSANLSYEITLMSKIIAQLSKELENSDIEIVEAHHHHKIDSPSGTALLLADSINKANHGIYYYEFNRNEKKSKRNPKEIGFSSIRGGNLVGEHRVIFFRENETFEVKHTAYSRTIFAEGAIKAAEWILEQSSGYYTSENLLEAL